MDEEGEALMVSHLLFRAQLGSDTLRSPGWEPTLENLNTRALTIRQGAMP